MDNMAANLRLETTDNEDDEKKAELTEHLAELRTRLIRSCLYAVLGMLLMYKFSLPIYKFLAAPILDIILKQHRGSFVVTNFTDPFFIKMQISMVGGLILAAPAIVLDLWGFIAPALTLQERKGVLFVAPMSVLLFIAGVTCAYLILPMAVRWFLSYLNDIPGAQLFQNPLTYVVFTVKMMLVFGLIFQLPVILMFLGKVGIITSAMMKQYWRHISVGLFTAAMVVAPSNDPGTMLALAIPLTLLFFGSIWLVKLVEPNPTRP